MTCDKDAVKFGRGWVVFSTNDTRTETHALLCIQKLIGDGHGPKVKGTTNKTCTLRECLCSLRDRKAYLHRVTKALPKDKILVNWILLSKNII